YCLTGSPFHYRFGHSKSSSTGTGKYSHPSEPVGTGNGGILPVNRLQRKYVRIEQSRYKCDAEGKGIGGRGGTKTYGHQQGFSGVGALRPKASLGLPDSKCDR